MDKSNTGNHHLSELCNNTVPRPSGSSLVKIDSITIDLSHIAMQKVEDANCRHSFSIRGYVAGMREKDHKTCLLFEKSIDSSAVSEDQLPPLVVPKFRWWRCENCMKDLLTNQNAGKESSSGTPSNSCRRSPFISCCLYSPKSCRGGSNTEKPAFEAASVPTSSIGVINAATCANNISPSLSRHATEATFEFEVANVHVDDVESKRERNTETSNGGGLNIMRSNQDLSQEAQIHEESEYIVQETENRSIDDRDRTASITRETPFTNNASEQALDNSLRDNAEVSSESDGESGKARFRLLADLLSGQVNPENTTGTDSAQASLDQIHVASSDGGSADLEKGHRKRKLNQELDSKVVKKVAERRPVAIDIRESQPNTVRQIKRRTEKESGVMKKKGKQIHVDDGCSSIIPWPMTPAGSGDLKKHEGNMDEQRFKYFQPLMESKKSSCVSFNNNTNKYPETRNFPSWVGESSIKRKNLEPWPHSQVGNFKFPHEAVGKVGLDLSLNSFKDPKARSIEIDYDQSGNLKKADRISDHRRKKGVLVREDNATVKADWSSLKGGLLCDLNAQTTIPFHGKQNISTSVEERSFPLHKKTDFSRQNSGAKHFQGGTDENIKHKKSQRRDEESSQQRPPDDIPMEIVELMAQNQYERGLSEKPIHHVINNNGGGKGYSSDIYGNNFTAWKSPPINYFHSNHSSKMVEENLIKLSGAHPLNPKKIPSGGQISVRNGFQCDEGANLRWLGPRTNTPFGFPNSTSQSRNREIDPQVHKGKTISDIKANEVKKSSESHLLFPKPQEIEKATSMYNKKTIGLESYSNEAIPAMQLLSLMDRKVTSNRAYNIEKPFVPCDYHSSLSREVTQNFFDRSLFPPQQHSKLFHDLRPHVSSPGESSQHSLPSTAYNQISFKSQEQEKSRSYASSPLRARRFHNSPSSSGTLHMTQGSFPARDIQNGLLTLPPPIPFSVQGHMLENRHKYFEFERKANSHGTFWPSKSIRESNICSLNQNPADFSIPEAGNVYTISWKDLKFGKKSFSRAVSTEIRKRPRVTKVRMGKEPQYGVD
ncbi:unnamed protein product [Cuscuta europaea]|uniref:Protein EMBRYONIC FLOWER 1-like n=1 Tax=Cuscuta europaea TaxID=41803 RepID=A0A9P1E2P8_CUSEU|nr:unnamed protein product [Cuscuta europaea]